jgi:adenylate cyclase
MRNYYLPLVGNTCWTIGRSSDNHLALPDKFMSRHHAVLQCGDLPRNGLGDRASFQLIDLISSNGSFVNGFRVILPVKLENGDRITFGNTQLAFYYPLHISSNSPISDRVIPQVTTRFAWRLVSVMAIDIRNFTVLAEQVPLAVLQAMLNTWLDDVAKIINASGGMLDRDVGNHPGTIKAIWFHRYLGVNSEDILGVFQAIRAINQRTLEFNREFALPLPLKIGAGINTGYGIVENTRIDKRPYYLAVESTAIAALNLGYATQKIGCDLALAESTYKYLSSLNHLESLFEQYTIHLEGFKSPVVTYAGFFADLELFLG